MIDARKFFLIGVWCFTIIGVANLINFFIFYSNGNLFSHIGSAANIFFNFITASFFYYLVKTQGGATATNLEDIDIERALKEFKNG